MFRKEYTVVLKKLDDKEEFNFIRIESIKALTKTSALKKAEKKYGDKYVISLENDLSAYAKLEQVIYINSKYIEQQLRVDYHKEIFKMQRELESSKREEISDKLINLDLWESKKILSSVMFHSYLTLRQLNFHFKENENSELRFIKAVSGIIADMLHNAPYMMVDKHYPNSPQEVHLRMIKDVIIEYTLLMEVLQKYIDTMSESNLKYSATLVWAYNFDLESHLHVAQ